MSWQAFSWHEIVEQARFAPLAERLQPAIDWTGTATQEAARFFGAFLTPLALTEGALGLWRLGADLGFAGEFFIADGILSHWQVWFALSIATQFASSTISRWLRVHPASTQLSK
jgi:hypothetical protein